MSSAWLLVKQTPPFLQQCFGGLMIGSLTMTFITGSIRTGGVRGVEQG